MKVKALRITQNNTAFYLTTLNSSFLGHTCSTNMKNIENSEDIYQRRLNVSRVNRIADYANRIRALFPTCVVLNSRTVLHYDSVNMELEIPEEDDTFFIVDGQHRIAGITKSHRDYMLPIVILNNVSVDDQSELFITINSEQKSVHPNVRFNMKSNDKYNTPEKMVRNIAEMINGDIDSPLYHKIWMDDASRKKGERPLSLSAFCEPICAYIYNPKDYYSIKDALYKSEGDTAILNIFSGKYENNILWTLYMNQRSEVLYKIILNYFLAIHDVYEEEWADRNSIIIKTTGYNAFMILFKEMFLYCRKNRNVFSRNVMYQVLSKKRVESKYFYAPIIGLGRSGAYELYRLLRPEEFKLESINSEFMDSLADYPDDEYYF